MLTTLTREALLPAHQRDFANCHASTLALLPQDTVVVAYFAGTKEGAGDTAIWLSRREQGAWLPPQRAIAEPGLAHWNPVLHWQAGRLWLFYKVGPDVHHWLTRVAVSDDGGVSWSTPVALVENDALPRGPVKNKLLVMSNGEWLAPGSAEDERYWDAFVDISADRGLSWHKAAIPLQHQAPTASEQQQLWQGLQQNALWENDLNRVFQWDGVIQPTAWESSPGQVHVLMRSTRGQVYRSDSHDYGRHWCSAYATTLPNNNSGIDVVRTPDGSLVLVFNPITGNWNRRYPLSVAVSRDNGEQWEMAGALETENGEFSYPAIVCEENELHITYTWNRTNIIYQKINIMQ